MDIAIIVLVLAAAGYAYLYFRNKRKAETWQGVVQNKRERSITHSDGDDSEWYELNIKLDSGDIKTIEVSEKLYDQFEIGDRLVKESGQMDPRKA